MQDRALQPGKSITDIFFLINKDFLLDFFARFCFTFYKQKGGIYESKNLPDEFNLCGQIDLINESYNQFKWGFKLKIQKYN